MRRGYPTESQLARDSGRRETHFIRGLLKKMTQLRKNASLSKRRTDLFAFSKYFANGILI
jgi:hypothetical protein